MINVLTLPAGTSDFSRRNQYTRGSGTITTKDNSIFLTTATAQIPLDETVLKFAKPGDSVTYQLHNSTVTLIINHDPENLPDPNFAREAAVFTPGRTDTGSSATLHAVKNIEHLRPGLYEFTETATALSFLTMNPDDELASQIENAIATYGKVSILIDSSGQSVSLFNPNETTTFLQTLRGLFQSAELKSLPVGHLLNLLETSGTLNFEKLSDLDTFLSTATHSHPSGRGGSLSAQKSILATWLQTALESPLPTLRMASIAPTVTADKIIHSIEEINSGISVLPDTPFIQSDSLITTNEITTTTRAHLLEKILSNMGISFEHDLMDKTLPGDTFPKNSIKAQLLSTFKTVAGSHEARALSVESPVTFPQPPADPVSETAPLLQTRLTGMEKQLNSFISLLTKSATGSGLSSLRFRHGQTQQPEVIDGSPGSRSSTVTPYKEHAPSDVQNPTLRRLLQDIQSFAVSISDSDDLNEILRLTARNIASHSGEILNNLSSDEVLSTESRHTVFISSSSNPISLNAGIFQTLLKDMDLLDAVIKTILFSSAPEGVRPDNRELPSSSTEPDNFSFRSGSSTAKSAESEQTVSIENKQELLSRIKDTLTAVESLQILAKKVDIPDGTRQIYAIPVKIGSEMTEVVIQLHKFKKGKRKAVSGSHFSVEINIAPSRLGSIQTHLDYHRSKGLVVNMEFERQVTLQWFKHTKEDLLPMLREHFKVPVNLVLKKMAIPAQAGDDISPFNKENSVIDMRV